MQKNTATNRQSHQYAPYLLLIIFLIAACSAQAAPQATPTPAPSSTSTPTNTPEPTLTPSSTPLTGGTLNEEGPWLSYGRHGNGHYLVNPDGTGKTKIDIPTDYFMYSYTSEKHGLLAAFEIIDLDDDYTMFLNIYEISKSKLVQSIELESDPRMRWSPDGQYLAFTGVADSSLNLYSYNAINNQVIQLTNLEHKVESIFWSPNSHWIIHDEIMGGPGYYVYNIWAATPDGSQVKRLFSPDNHLGQRNLGWLDNSRFVSLGNAMEEPDFIRLINVDTGENSLLYKGAFALGGPSMDADNQIIVFNSTSENLLPDRQLGIYMIPIQSPHIKLISQDYIFQNYDEQQHTFITDGECLTEDNLSGYLGFQSDGILTCVQPSYYSTDISSLTKYPSPDGKWILLYENQEICLHQGNQECAFQFEAKLNELIWREDSAGFFILTNMESYYVPMDSLQPMMFDKYPATSAKWIGTEGEAE